MRLRPTWDIVKQTAKEFSADKCARLGAALAFYTALSLSPMLLVVIGIAGPIFGPEAARGGIAHQLRDLVGDDGAKVVEDMLAKSASKKDGIIATIIGLAALLYAATGVFAQLQDALNTVWNVKEEQTPQGVWGMLKSRLLSFSAVCGLAFLLLVSLVFSALVSGLSGRLEQWVPYSSVWLQLGNLLLSLLVTTLLFAMIYKLLPAVRPAWRDVWVGALATAVLFNLGKYLIGLYLGNASVGSTFGAAGSFVVLLFWIYYSAQVVLFGAEFTQVYATTHGAGLATPEPARGAREAAGGPKV
ncbi:MAG TPA: YihY/virulence factor BrkB family protein [Gemmataceae bacterium]|nr:YihY/virulence factor BrkB family protein [Gemmataceae bacterium]